MKTSLKLTALILRYTVLKHVFVMFPISQGPQSQKTLLDFLIELPPADSHATSSHEIDEPVVESSPPVSRASSAASTSHEDEEDQNSWMTSLTEAELVPLDSEDEEIT